ncbi:MAG: 30S ribosomal protein S9 [Candidatus Nomurabacteria bacterium]|nr:30S ribosomal protein S9 [Candidatus Nomurabacteria bacterium]
MSAVTKKTKYIPAIGRRKTASAQVRLFEAAKTEVIINDKKLSEYFKTDDQIKIVNDAFNTLKLDQEFKVTVLVKGGGLHAQAEAVRHGISRALVERDEASRVPLKKEGFLKRDPRSKERNKPGLRGARRAPQWSKR